MLINMFINAAMYLFQIFIQAMPLNDAVDQLIFMSDFIEWAWDVMSSAAGVVYYVLGRDFCIGIVEFYVIALGVQIAFAMQAFVFSIFGVDCMGDWTD